MSALADRIDDAFRSLSPQEQVVAAFLRARPDESALYNSSELARRTGVSKATVSRLYRRLGFADSSEARHQLRAERSAGVPVVTRPVDDDPAARQLESDLDNLRRAYAALDRSVVAGAADAIARAERVVVVGLRSGAGPALLLRQALAQVRPGVVLAPLPGQTIAEEVVGLGSGDVLVVVAPRRRPAVAAALLELTAATPALLVTDDRDLGARARWVVRVPVESASAFDSMAATASVVALIAGEVARAVGDAGQQRVHAIVGMYRQLGELE